MAAVTQLTQWSGSKYCDGDVLRQYMIGVPVPESTGGGSFEIALSMDCGDASPLSMRWRSHFPFLNGQNRAGK